MNNFNQVKIRVTVPKDAADKIREVLGKAGAGKIGNYTHCTTSYSVTGRFLPGDAANPTIGRIGELEKVEEEMIETVCEFAKLKEVILSLRQAHPYEEPAIDIVPLINLD